MNGIYSFMYYVYTLVRAETTRERQTTQTMILQYEHHCKAE